MPRQKHGYRCWDSLPQTGATSWLPDGRLVFSSSRWPNYPEYGHARGTNLHVVNADGTGEHRITTERNGADRPIIDPVTGKIVFARWWLNGRFPSDYMGTLIIDYRGGYTAYAAKDGLTNQDNSVALQSGGGPVQRTPMNGLLLQSIQMARV